MPNLTFATKKEATEFLQSIDWLYEHSKGFSPSGTYCLAHGEQEAPDYKPVKYKDGWGVKVVFNYLPNTLNTKKDGRCCHWVERDRYDGKEYHRLETEGCWC